MSKFEKVMNIGMKILGVIFAIDSIRIFLGYFVPSVGSIGILYLLIAIFLLFSKYTKPNRKEYKI